MKLTQYSARPRYQVRFKIIEPGDLVFTDLGLRFYSTFSPEGRLFQVEYSLEAIKLGSTAIGVRYDKERPTLALGTHSCGAFAFTTGADTEAKPGVQI